jgi:D-alanine transaminase
MAEPLPWCYVNGSFVPLVQARISPFDRGFLYGDGVYEVMAVYGGRPFRFGQHCARLTRSLEAIRMQDPHSRDEWRRLIGELIERNGHRDQSVYWQVTRGAERGRNHAPLPEIPRTIFAFCAPLAAQSQHVLENGVTCVTLDDTRWARCDIKSISLLANVLLRQAAIDGGATEAILIRDGMLTEAAAAATHVVTEGVIRTPPHSDRLLPGTTRGVIEELAARAGIAWREAAVSEAELRGASEIWLSAASREITPVTTLDGAPVGAGRPGTLWQRIIKELERYKRELAGTPW